MSPASDRVTRPNRRLVPSGRRITMPYRFISLSTEYGPVKLELSRPRYHGVRCSLGQPRLTGYLRLWSKAGLQLRHGLAHDPRELSVTRTANPLRRASLIRR